MSPVIHLFQGYGVELEYMIVDRETLDVLPVTDRVLYDIVGRYESEVEVGTLCWSNELVLHVIELKTNGPSESLNGLAALFHRDVQHINRILEPMGAMLMPTAMHPWMDPHTQTKLWPHEFSPVYESFNRIFNCRGHGWSNLQSTHVNLPFFNDDEFGRLHAAIRLVLPILPALAASSPIIDATVMSDLDARLDVYRHNARRVPSVCGRVIPEPVFTQADYQARILEPMYRDIAPLDPDGILQFEWLNARGAIARFDRNTIEIRVLDIQECPQADLAIIKLIDAAIRALIAQRWTSFEAQKDWPVAPLEAIFLNCVRHGDQAMIDDADFLQTFGTNKSSMTAGSLWQHMQRELLDNDEELAPLDAIFQHGCLARRIVSAVGVKPAREKLAEVYRQLCTCLQEGRVFAP